MVNTIEFFAKITSSRAAGVPSISFPSMSTQWVPMTTDISAPQIKKKIMLNLLRS